MGLFIPCAVEGRDLDAIFAEKVPKVKDNKREKWFVGVIGSSDGEHQPVLEIYHDDDADSLLNHRKRMLNEGLAMVALEFG